MIGDSSVLVRAYGLSTAGTEYDINDLRETMRSQIGATMFKEEGVTFRFQLFSKSIDERVHQLEDSGYAVADYDSFRQVMGMETKVVVADGVMAQFGKAIPIVFLWDQFTMSTGSLKDCWLFRHASRLQTVAIMSSQVPLMPWERILVDSPYSASISFAMPAVKKDVSPELVQHVMWFLYKTILAPPPTPGPN